MPDEVEAQAPSNGEWTAEDLAERKALRQLIQDYLRTNQRCLVEYYEGLSVGLFVHLDADYAWLQLGGVGPVVRITISSVTLLGVFPPEDAPPTQ